MRSRKMGFRVRTNVHWCISGGRVIFLDAEADRYFCLSLAANAAFLRLFREGRQPGDGQFLCSLVRRGVLLEDAAPSALTAPTAIPPATADLMNRPGCSSNLLDIARALAAEAGAAWRLRTQSLPAALRSPRRIRARGRHDVAATLRRIVSAFAALSLFLRSTDRCLVRALAVHSACRRQGIDTRLVLGVRTNPFGAHSWVQLGDSVIFGDFEQVRLYTPIAVLP